MNTLDQRLLKAAFIFVAAAVAIGATATAALLPSGNHARATHVVPEFLAGPGPVPCTDSQGPGQTWIEFELEGATLSNGSHSGGILEVTISNLTQDSFDWTSNIGVDAVVVKGGIE